jgi:hypothetical protein
MSSWSDRVVQESAAGSRRRFGRKFIIYPLGIYSLNNSFRIYFNLDVGW